MSTIAPISNLEITTFVENTYLHFHSTGSSNSDNQLLLMRGSKKKDRVQLFYTTRRQITSSMVEDHTTLIKLVQKCLNNYSGNYDISLLAQQLNKSQGILGSDVPKLVVWSPSMIKALEVMRFQGSAYIPKEFTQIGGEILQYVISLSDALTYIYSSNFDEESRLQKLYSLKSQIIDFTNGAEKTWNTLKFNKKLIKDFQRITQIASQMVLEGKIKDLQFLIGCGIPIYLTPASPLLNLPPETFEKTKILIIEENSSNSLPLIDWHLTIQNIIINAKSLTYVKLLASYEDTTSKLIKYIIPKLQGLITLELDITSANENEEESNSDIITQLAENNTKTLQNLFLNHFHLPDKFVPKTRFSTVKNVFLNNSNSSLSCINPNSLEQITSTNITVEDTGLNTSFPLLKKMTLQGKITKSYFQNFSSKDLNYIDLSFDNVNESNPDLVIETLFSRISIEKLKSLRLDGNTIKGTSIGQLNFSSLKSLALSGVAFDVEVFKNFKAKALQDIDFQCDLAAYVKDAQEKYSTIQKVNPTMQPIEFFGIVSNELNPWTGTQCVML